MTFWKEYQEYIDDNPQQYWFKAKLFGWGWTPVRWQGWAVIALYVLLITACSLTIDERSQSKEVFFTFLLPAVLLTSTLIRICYAKGEKPSWRWGFKKSNKDIEHGNKA